MGQFFSDATANPPSSLAYPATHNACPTDPESALLISQLLANDIAVYEDHLAAEDLALSFALASSNPKGKANGMDLDEGSASHMEREDRKMALRLAADEARKAADGNAFSRSDGPIDCIHSFISFIYAGGDQSFSLLSHFFAVILAETLDREAAAASRQTCSDRLTSTKLAAEERERSTHIYLISACRVLSSYFISAELSVSCPCSFFVRTIKPRRCLCPKTPTRDPRRQGS